VSVADQTHIPDDIHALALPYSPTPPQEQYVQSAKDEVDSADPTKAVYSLGPRFYAEVSGVCDGNAVLC
jgi:hypothetical protein